MIFCPSAAAAEDTNENNIVPVVNSHACGHTSYRSHSHGTAFGPNKYHVDNDKKSQTFLTHLPHIV